MVSGIEKVVEKIDEIPEVKWDFEGIHYFDNGPLTVQYLLVLDALNFCFWPGITLLFLKNKNKNKNKMYLNYVAKYVIGVKWENTE